MPLEQAKLAEARYVTIRVPVPAWDRAKGERLRDILGSHRGRVPGDAGDGPARAPSRWRWPQRVLPVRPDAALRRAR